MSNFQVVHKSCNSSKGHKDGALNGALDVAGGTAT